jgi:MBG domain (YGX type)
MSSKLRRPRLLRAAVSMLSGLVLIGMTAGVAQATLVPVPNGTMTVAQASAAGGVSGQSFVFDFYDNSYSSFPDGSQLVLVIPDAWPAPQISNPTGANYVTAVLGASQGANDCGSPTVSIATRTITIPQTCGENDHLTITYGPVTPPTATGPFTFVAQTKYGFSGTPTTLAPSAIITVDTLAITFYKEVCPRYTDVPANRSSGSSDATGGHSAELNAGYQTSEASPADRPAACAASKGWSFDLREGSGGPLIQIVTTGNDGSYTVYLGLADIAWARGGGVWVNEGLSPAVAGFGALRCYHDILNGDNLDYVGGVPTGTNQAYCLAYNVRQIITFDPLANQIYGAGPITLGATASSNLPVTYNASGSCTLSGNSLTLTGVGSCTVTAHQVGQASPFWSAADDVSRTFTIGKATLTVTGPTTNQPYGTATSTFTPIYGPFVTGDGPSTLGTQPTCTSGTTATSPTGVYDITCGGAVSDKYDFIYTAGKLTIGKATLTVKADDQNRAYGAANPTPLTFTYSGWVGGDGTSSISTPPTCSTAADASSAAGTTWPITCSSGTSTNYDFHFVDGALTVGKAGQTITFVKPADRTYGDAPFDLGGSASSGLTVSYSVDSGPCSVLGSTLTITGVGNCSITASQGGNDTYSAAADVSRTFAIGKVGATCTIIPYNVTYNGIAHTATGSCTGIGDVVLSGLDLSGTTHMNAADYATDAWTFSNADYTSQSGTVHDVIGQAKATCTVTPYDVTYDGIAHTATGSCTVAGLVLTGTTHTSANTYNDDAWSFHDPAGNYADTSGFVNDAIGQARATCTVTPYDVTYNGIAHTATGSCTGIGDVVLGGLDLSGTTHTAPGNYATDPWTFSNPNYASQSGTVGDVIGKAAELPILTVTADNKSRAFGAANPAFTFIASPSVSLDTAPTCTTTADASSAVGTYPITCTGAALAGYSVGYVDGTLTITAASLTITADNKTRAFGAMDPVFTFVVSPSVSLDTQPTCTSTTVALSPVGTYPITCKDAVKAGYSISYAPGTLTVTALPIVTMTADNKTRVVGAADPAFTFVVSPSVSLLIPPTCTSTAIASSPAGTYPISCTGAVADGYTVNYVAGTLTITGTEIVEGATATPTVAPTVAPTATPTVAPTATPTVAPTATPTVAPTATPIEIVESATGTPRAVTPPPTSSDGSSPSNGSLPLMLILIALAFGGLGMLAVQAQRRTIRR